MKSLKIALLGTTLLFAGAAFAATTSVGGRDLSTASYAAPEGTRNMTYASYAAPEGSHNMTYASVSSDATFTPVFA